MKVIYSSIGHDSECLNFSDSIDYYKIKNTTKKTWYPCHISTVKFAILQPEHSLAIFIGAFCLHFPFPYSVPCFRHTVGTLNLRHYFSEQRKIRKFILEK